MYMNRTAELALLEKASRARSQASIPWQNVTNFWSQSSKSPLSNLSSDTDQWVILTNKNIWHFKVKAVLPWFSLMVLMVHICVLMCPFVIRESTCFVVDMKVHPCHYRACNFIQDALNTSALRTAKWILPGIQKEMTPAMTEKYLFTTKSQVSAAFSIEFCKCSGSE